MTHLRILESRFVLPIAIVVGWKLSWQPERHGRDGEPCFCFRFGIIFDGAIPSSESISTVVFGQIFVLLEQCRCLNLSEKDRRA